MQKIGFGVAIVGVLIMCATYLRGYNIMLSIGLGVSLILIGIVFFVVVRSPPSSKSSPNSDDIDELWSQKKTGKK